MVAWRLNAPICTVARTRQALGAGNGTVATDEEVAEEGQDAAKGRDGGDDDDDGSPPRKSLI